MDFQATKTQKQLINEECMNHFTSTKFNNNDRRMIAKMRQQDYKEGFINGSKLKPIK